LRFLALGFGEAMGELREVTWIAAPSQNEGEREAATDTLAQVLRLLLGEKSDTKLKELKTPTGE
jgi:hypothetical protein